MEVTRQEWKPLSPELSDAVQAFSDWSDHGLAQREKSEKIKDTLFHYTDAMGLDGIIKNQEMWFTHYLHLNDTSEFEFGMNIACQLADEKRKKHGGLTEIFCETLKRLARDPTVLERFAFFIASFSSKANDLGQWRAYGDNGRGYALGLSSHLFHATENPDTKKYANNVVVAPVIYGERAGRKRHQPAIEKAVEIVDRAIREMDNTRDPSVHEPFFDKLAIKVLACQIIWNNLTIKHEAFKDEAEVRMVIVGAAKLLAPDVLTRPSGGQIIPFIKKHLPLQTPGNIAKIWIGPAAAAPAEHGVRSLLRPFLPNPDEIIERSRIPYRPAR